MKFNDKEKYRSELREIDWDFTGEVGDAGFATFHWYPARYVPQLPGILVNYFSEAGDTVLDPFCGSGTTLIEAFKFGRRAVGIDLAPNAVLMTRAKTTEYEEKSFKQYKIGLLSNVENKIIQALSSHKSELALLRSIPKPDQNAKWFHNSTLVELSAIWVAINENSGNRYTDVARATFSAILIQCCSQEKHWGWVCDNVQPKELIYRNALAAYASKLTEYERSIRQLLDEAKDLQEASITISDIQTREGNSADVLKEFPNDYFDLVVTSPPYFSVTDYVKSQRLSNLWLEVDTDTLKRQEIGARYKRARLEGLNEYLTGMEDAFVEIVRVLKHGNFCCVVLGESPHHEPYLGKFERLCVQAGFDLQDSISRTISASRRFIASVKREKILILKKK